MLRSLFMAMEAQPAMAKKVAKATIAHLTQEHLLLLTDPVTAWAQTRWPDFVEICQCVRSPPTMPGHAGIHTGLRPAPRTALRTHPCFLQSLRRICGTAREPLTWHQTANTPTCNQQPWC